MESANVLTIAGRVIVSPMRLRGITLAVILSLACADTHRADMSADQRTAVSDTLRTMIAKAYDLTSPGDPVSRLMSLYPTSGPVVSASGGIVSTSRDTLEAGIRAFWDNVGRNMRNPKWTWATMHVDVLAPDAAVVTTTYSVSHLTPRNEPHVIAGAWTAVFQRRDGRWVIVQEHLSDTPPSPSTTP